MSEPVEVYDVQLGESEVNPNSLKLDELNDDVLKMIVRRLDFKSTRCLRKVCWNLRLITDCVRPALREIFTDYCFRDHVYTCFDRTHVAYSNLQREFRWYNGPLCKLVKTEDYMEAALEDLFRALKYSKLQLNSLRINFDDSWENLPKAYWRQSLINSFMKSLNHQISVKHFHLVWRHRGDAVAILSHLKPGTLERIELFYDAYTPVVEMDELVELEQCKQAKSFSVNGLVRTPIVRFLSFKNFDITCHSVSVQDLLSVRDILAETPRQQRPKFDISWKSRMSIDNLREALQLDEDGKYEIPNSDEVLKFLISTSSIKFSP